MTLTKLWHHNDTDVVTSSVLDIEVYVDSSHMLLTSEYTFAFDIRVHICTSHQSSHLYLTSQYTSVLAGKHHPGGAGWLWVHEDSHSHCQADVVPATVDNLLKDGRPTWQQHKKHLQPTQHHHFRQLRCKTAMPNLGSWVLVQRCLYGLPVNTIVHYFLQWCDNHKCSHREQRHCRRWCKDLKTSVVQKVRILR